ncbi:MAG TPA: peptidoglycan-binding protein, partial [Xanthomonadales bacterium]|nr:peptidoglycan-binding protein [Xanthomonadales bacterium]
HRSGGVPRLINIIADRALSGAYALEKDQVNAKLVNAAANEVQPSESKVAQRSNLPWALAAVTFLTVAGLAISWQQGWLNLRLHPAVEKNSGSATGLADAKSANPPATLPESDNGMSTGTGALAAKSAEETPPSTASSSLTGATKSALPLRDPAWSYDSLARAEAIPETWLADQHLLAYPGLAQLWQEMDQAKALLLACEGVTATGFACLTERGNWAKVRDLGLPVILVLRSNGDKHVLLRGMDGQRILLGAGSTPRYFSREKVEELWMGEYIVAWPQSPDWPEQIRRNDRNAAADIVLSMAVKADPPWQGEAQFDVQFENWLKAFQRSHGLLDDGIVGPQTLLYLMAPTIVEPRLELAIPAGS